MTVRFNHTIVAAKDKVRSASFLAELLGLPEPQPLGHFLVVKLSDGASLDYIESSNDFPGQHYAFLVSEDVFDSLISKIRARGIQHWADPRGQHPGEINTHDGGRGVYFQDPSGHYLEALTVPYGGW
ncbi:catechol 2,3-dioxygenase-like lactoylglutathione lyase family enzyme [Archangium gephyra]|uniref:Catechol 2,3-dioxygenase-like lactoylglutathione lyase family enzyme n=1 Tax=Archangium gephyra TaxID=48 RepID=A0AAC8Q9N2_9BACT|nr:VOC family protein [Archangium gephyra]AKJ03469.1 Glyoxalase/bleomycin resistance protein/dioxygenase [Archangium gephyra]REG24024.1 catechol 2,3-dioxygenase-like lactoylglutathione lyase family enzyme [Archangium gephyra]